MRGGYTGHGGRPPWQMTNTKQSKQRRNLNKKKSKTPNALGTNFSLCCSYITSSIVTTCIVACAIDCASFARRACVLQDALILRTLHNLVKRKRMSRNKTPNTINGDAFKPISHQCQSIKWFNRFTETLTVTIRFQLIAINWKYFC